MKYHETFKTELGGLLALLPGARILIQSIRSFPNALDFLVTGLLGFSGLGSLGLGAALWITGGISLFSVLFLAAGLPVVVFVGWRFLANWRAASLPAAGRRLNLARAVVIALVLVVVGFMAAADQMHTVPEPRFSPAEQTAIAAGNYAALSDQALSQYVMGRSGISLVGLSFVGRQVHGPVLNRIMRAYMNYYTHFTGSRQIELFSSQEQLDMVDRGLLPQPRPAITTGGRWTTLTAWSPCPGPQARC